MYPVRYIHAADLHLDAAFKGLSFDSPADKDLSISTRLHQATFTALDRLVDLCEAEKPDFLVIAGDIYNQEDCSIKAQLRLRDACQRLAKHSIQVFLAHGNHDPLSSRLQTLHWPDNVVIFGEGLESHAVWRDNSIVAVVHGISHSTDKESRNLAKGFSRRLPQNLTPQQDDDCFHLGVLHCSLDSSSTADRYAPCSLEDLKNAHMDAWALGHIHQRNIVCPQPFVAYAGNTQGLHIQECGPKGCLLVQAMPETRAALSLASDAEASAKSEAAPDASPNIPQNSSSSAQAFNSNFSCSAAFHALGPVQWENLELDMDNVSAFDTLENRMHDSLEQAAARTGVGCQTLIARLRLRGRTSLDKDLRSAHVLQDLVERVRGASQATPEVWLKDIIVDTGQELDMAALCSREDLLGEIVRMSTTALEGTTASATDTDAAFPTARALVEPALHTLFNHSKASKILKASADDEYYTTLLKDAQRLCIDLMETR